jgi:hypothetical protein
MFCRLITFVKFHYCKIVLGGGMCLGSGFDRYFCGSITPDIRSVGGWMCPSASLGVLEKR